MNISTKQSRFQFSGEQSFFADLRQWTIKNAIPTRGDNLLAAFQAGPCSLKKTDDISCLPARQSRRSGTKNQGHMADKFGVNTEMCVKNILCGLKAKSNHL